MSDVVEILRALVAIPSESRLSNRPLTDEVSRRLHACGWQVRELEYGDAAGVKKVNLIARPAGQDPAQPDVDLAWICHSDTVPPAPGWQHAMELQERDGMLHGCGACDVKGALACFLAAATRLAGQPLRAQSLLIVTADEEIGCVGTERLLAAGAIRPRRLIVGEPTSLAPAIAGKGYGLADVEVRGRPAHSAFPREGVSAVRVAAGLIAQLYSRETRVPGASNALFDPPVTTANVGTVQGGTAKNVIAEECRFQVEWRPIPEDDARGLGEELRALGKGAEVAEPGCTVRVELRRAEPGFRLPGAKLGAELATMLKTEPCGIAFSSEASRWARVAEEIVVLGPGDMRTAHSERECVPKAELLQWTDCIARLLQR